MCDTRPTICLLGLEETLERVVATQLQHQGYRTVHGDDVAELRELQPAPAAVILDLDSMDTESRGDTPAWAQTRRWQGPALLLTADRIPKRRQQQLGDALILFKPFTLDELLSQLASCLSAKGGRDR